VQRIVFRRQIFTSKNFATASRAARTTLSYTRKGASKKMKRLVVMIALLFVPALAKADQVWMYTGNSVNNFSMNPFLPPAANPCGCAIDGTVVVNNLGQALSWSFTAGSLTLTNLNSTGGGFLGFAQADPTDFWSFNFQGANGSVIHTFFEGSVNDANDNAAAAGTYFLTVGSDEGAWAQVVGTPEPGALSLLLVGLLAAMTGCVVRQRRQVSEI
jgi:hypothetical protein